MAEKILLHRAPKEDRAPGRGLAVATIHSDAFDPATRAGTAPIDVYLSSPVNRVPWMIWPELTSFAWPARPARIVIGFLKNCFACASVRP